MSFQVGTQAEHPVHGRGEVTWVYRYGLLVEFAGEDQDRHIEEAELVKLKEPNGG